VTQQQCLILGQWFHYFFGHHKLCYVQWYINLLVITSYVMYSDTLILLLWWWLSIYNNYHHGLYTMIFLVCQSIMLSAVLWLCSPNWTMIKFSKLVQKIFSKYNKNLTISYFGKISVVICYYCSMCTVQIIDNEPENYMMVADASCTCTTHTTGTPLH